MSWSQAIPGKRWRRLLLTILVLLAATWWWYHVPVLDYLPVTSAWKVEASAAWSRWWLPCIYWRYRVPGRSADLAAGLRPVLAAVGGVAPWELSREALRDRLAAHLSAQEQARQNWDAILAQSTCGELAIHTDRPFLYMSCAVPPFSSLWHLIRVRIIDAGPNESVLEVFDEQDVDR